MGKYEKLALDVLSKDYIMSTREIALKLEKKTGKTVNWHILYKALSELERNGKAERLKAKAGFFWRKL